MADKCVKCGGQLAPLPGTDPKMKCQDCGNIQDRQGRSMLTGGFTAPTGPAVPKPLLG